jgi:hypothetical protein
MGREAGTDAGYIDQMMFWASRYRLPTQRAQALALVNWIGFSEPVLAWYRPRTRTMPISLAPATTASTFRKYPSFGVSGSLFSQGRSP